MVLGLAHRGCRCGDICIEGIIRAMVLRSGSIGSLAGAGQRNNGKGRTILRALRHRMPRRQQGTGTVLEGEFRLQQKTVFAACKYNRGQDLGIVLGHQPSFVARTWEHLSLGEQPGIGPPALGGVAQGIRERHYLLGLQLPRRSLRRILGLLGSGKATFLDRVAIERWSPPARLTSALAFQPVGTALVISARSGHLRPAWYHPATLWQSNSASCAE